MKNLIVFIPSITNGGMEKNFFSTAKNLKKKGINILGVSCSKNKFKKKVNLKRNYGLLELDKINLKIKLLLSFFILIIKNFYRKYPVLSFQGNIFAIIASKIIGCKVYIRLNSHPDYYIKNSFQKSMFTFFYKMANNIIVNSKEIQNLLKYKYNLNSSLIYNEIDNFEIIRKSRTKINLNFFKKYPLLISVGRLDKNKNHIFLIKAIQKIKKKLNYNFLILGSGPLKKFLLNKIDQYELSNRIKIIDYKKNPYPYIKKADFLVLSSISEGYPNVLIEAGILNKLIISSNCKSGPCEIINKNQRGYLFNLNSSSQFIKILTQISNRGKEKKKIIALKKYIKKNHSKDHSEQYLKLII